MKKPLLIPTFVILMSSFALAATLSISPGTLELNGKANENICGKLILGYSSSGDVEGTDLWAPEGTEKRLSLYNLNAEDVGITITYPTPVSLISNANKEISVCVKSQDPGIFQGALYYVPVSADGNQAPGVGTWLNIGVSDDTPEPPENTDLDGDGVDNNVDDCPGTPAEEGVNAQGCSCSQLVVDDGNVCTSDSCNNGIITHTNNNAQCGYSRNCPSDSCSGTNWVDYPNDGHDYCSGGTCNMYSCAAISSDYSADCDDNDADDDGVIDTSDSCPNTPDGESVNSEGCSCSQLIIDDGNVCTTDSCNNGIVTHTNNNAQCGYSRNCPSDRCRGSKWLDYPSDSHDYCSEGTCNIYSCALISSTRKSRCDDDDDDDKSSTNEESDENTYFLTSVTANPSPDCTENWKCESWSKCVKDKQTRTCEDTNKCGTAKNKPVESRSCSIKTTDLMGYAVAPTPKTNNAASFLVGIFIILLIIIVGVSSYLLIVYVGREK